MKPSKKITSFMASYETLHDGDLSRIHLQPKVCPAGYWTEGFGRVLKGPDGKMLKYGGRFVTIDSVLPFSKIKTEAQALLDLESRLSKLAPQVQKRLKVPVTQNQFDALISHADNCGFSETLYRLINAKASAKDIKNWFTTKYITGAGKFLLGLQYRRNDEYEIWSGVDYDREYNRTV